MDYSLAEIRAFNATVQCGNFSRAAEKLGVSQPAITAQIRKLETRFDFPLLERFSKGVVPTELGRQLYRITCQYQDLEGAVEVLANPHKAPGEMTLRIATASPFVFMPLIALFRQRFSDIQLKIVSATTTDCQDMVLNREVDISLCPVLDETKGLSRLSFHAHKIIAIIPPQHLLAAQDEVNLAELAAQQLIFSRPHACTQLMVDEYFAEQNLHPSSHIVMDNRQEICEAVAHNLGIGFALENDIRPDERICIRPIAEIKTSVVEHVSWLKNRSSLPGIRDFIQLALDQRCSQIPAVTSIETDQTEKGALGAELEGQLIGA